MRISLPVTGGEDDEDSLIRVLASSSTVTCMGPRVTSARSTLTGFGLSANARPPAAAAASDAIKMSLATRDAIALQPLSIARLQHRDEVELIDPPAHDEGGERRRDDHDQLALAKVARSITKGTR